MFPNFFLRETPQQADVLVICFLWTGCTEKTSCCPCRLVHWEVILRKQMNRANLCALRTPLYLRNQNELLWRVTA